MKHQSKKVLTIICISLLLMSLAPRTAHGQQIDSASDIDISVIEGQQPILNSPGQLSAAGAVVIEQSTGKVLYGKYEDRRLYPASTTKILTALLAAEYGDLDETIVVGEEIFLAALDGSKAGLEENEEITLRASGIRTVDPLRQRCRQYHCGSYCPKSFRKIFLWRKQWNTLPT